MRVGAAHDVTLELMYSHRFSTNVNRLAYRLACCVSDQL